MNFKTRYLLAKKNGQVERFRGDEVSKEISKTVPISRQIAILMDKDTEPEQFAQYQLVRIKAKQVVDTKIAAIEAELQK